MSKNRITKIDIRENIISVYYDELDPEIKNLYTTRIMNFDIASISGCIKWSVKGCEWRYKDGEPAKNVKHKKFFRACHKESGKVVEFNLGDIEPDDYNIFLPVSSKPREYVNWDTLTYDDDYKIQYYHNGEYHDYEENK